MDSKLVPWQKIVLVLFVLAISLGIGWYGEKAVEKYFAINQSDNF